MGKTSFAMNMVEYIGLTQKAVCLVFSLEMSADQLATRMLCSQAKVDSQDARTGKIGAVEINKFAEAMKELSGTEIYIDDSASITPTEMLAKAEPQKSKGLGLIAIDYLQLMQAGGRTESRQQEVAQITRTLKIMAKELNVPILLLSQLSRASENGTRNRGIRCFPTCASRARSNRMQTWLFSCTGRIIIRKTKRRKTWAKRASSLPNREAAQQARSLCSGRANIRNIWKWITSTMKREAPEY